jgi:hypothetical protein
MALFDTNSGLGNLFEGMNIFGARQPEYLGGLLNKQQEDKLKNQALLSGVLGAGATYLAQPKNQNIGLGAILGKSYLGGMQQSQGTYDAALKSKMDALTMAKNMKELEMSGMTDIQKLLKAKNELNPESPTYQGDLTAINNAITKSTNVDSTFIRNYEYAVQKGYKGTPEDWQKLNIVTQQSYLNPAREAETNYKYGNTGPTVNPPKFATMKDVSDTAIATGKTTDQVIKDFKAKNIEVRTR